MQTVYSIIIHDKTGVEIYKLNSISKLIIIIEVSADTAERSHEIFERPDNNTKIALCACLNLPKHLSIPPLPHFKFLEITLHLRNISTVYHACSYCY